MGALDEPKLPKLPYIYRATVVKIESNGRVRLKVYGIHDGIAKDVAPIAEPALDIFGAGDGSGMASVPGVGTDVWVFFDGGEINSPVYFAKATTKAEFSQLASDTQTKILLPTGKCITIEADGATITLCNGNVIIKGGTILLN